MLNLVPSDRHAYEYGCTNLATAVVLDSRILHVPVEYSIRILRSDFDSNSLEVLDSAKIRYVRAEQKEGRCLLFFLKKKLTGPQKRAT